MRMMVVITERFQLEQSQSQLKPDLGVGGAASPCRGSACCLVVAVYGDATVGGSASQAPPATLEKVSSQQAEM